MKFSSLGVRKILLLLGMVAAVTFEVVPAFANKMVSGADLKKEINAFLAARNFMGDPAISDARLFPNCLTGIKVKPMFGSLKTVEISCADMGGFKLAIRTNAVSLGKHVVSDQETNMNELGRKFLNQEDKDLEKNVFLVLSRSLQKGKILSEEDIRWKQARNQNLSGYFTKASDVVGRTLKKNLNINQVLLSRHLEIAWDIRKGQKIIIQSNAGPVTIENSGVATVDAQIGQLLKAENEQSGKIVEGIVVSRKKIRILTK
ncbi:flagellar basal body P-ring formation chaperone FlgA [Candidatus Puniceispirillum sp.]|nr:flagellar basal body P-ring formation chaperone FlgA [Alphaproteobacteria bacterium]MDC1293739.1 flagellar basal body P-ring formation chaperone FlgA [Candidatus Puniceispirillum sp.]